MATDMLDSATLQPQSSTPETAGEILSSARKARQLSIADVASNLNLRREAIEALEQDQYERLPGCTFVRGYLRAYASLLRLDPEQVMHKVELKTEQMTGVPTVPTIALKLNNKAKSRPNRTWSNRQSSKRSSKSKGLFLKSMLSIIVLAGVSLFGLNQWAHLDTEKLARFLKLPIARDAAKIANDSNAILFPATKTPDSPAEQE